MEHHFLNRKKRLPANWQGFSLLELLIVIAIIGILVSVGVASYSQAQKKTRDSRRTSDMKAIQAAWEQYYSDNNGSYPASCTITAAYMPAGVPSDPKTSVSYATGATCTATTYCFCASIESGNGNSGAACDYSAVTKSFFCVNNLQ
jgi:type IV pilus assembly protein PilA